MDKRVPFVFGGRGIFVPVRIKRIRVSASADARMIRIRFEESGKRRIDMVAEQRLLRIPFAADVPIEIIIHKLRIWELDSRRIGVLDPYPIPDNG